MDKSFHKGKNKRRQVLIGIGSASVIGVTGLGAYFSLNKILNNPASNKKETYKPTEEKLLKLGIIGFGIRGEHLARSLGFATLEWKKESLKSSRKNNKDTRYQNYINQPSLNVEFKGICDLFDVRVEKAKNAFGKKVKRYRHYQDLINSNEIDAVIIATPDHWHAQMTIDAVKAGKHVYVEKCFTQTIEETYQAYDAVKESGLVFQLGHQLRHTDSYHAAKESINQGLLGEISLIQTNSNRNSPNGAWIYHIHPKANDKTVDWKYFHQKNNQSSFDADRFFRWRKYWEYGTGLFGDLMTHDFDAINQILEMGIPETVMASGGNYYWKDGREVPDVLQVSMEYPSKGFTYLYSASQANQYHRPNLIMGDDATMEIGARMNIYPDPNSKRYKDKLSSGQMDVKTPFYSSGSSKDVDAISSATTKYFANKGMLYTYRDGKRLDPTYLHLEEWLNAIRYGGTTSCNIEQAFQEAIATHMAVKSYKEKRQVKWDKVSKRII